MIPEDRREQILDNLHKKNFMTVSKLAKILYVSEPTIRRDLKLLEIEGSVKRSHGGANYVDKPILEWPFKLRNRTQLEEKRKIGKIAASLVVDVQNIFINSSSTCLSFAQEIDPNFELNILTNGNPIAQYLGENTKMSVEFPGGSYNARHASIFGYEAKSFIKKRHVDLFFISSNGIDEKYGLTGRLNLDLHITHAFHNNSNKTIVLMDHTQINKYFYYSELLLDQIDILITDKKLPKEFSKACIENNIEVLY